MNQKTSDFDWTLWEPQSDSEYFAQRQPWWANPETNEVYIGPKGSYHPHPVPQGFVLGEYWPHTGEVRATNWEGERARQAEELVRRHLFPPVLEEETPTERAMRKYRERGSSADHWWEPAMTELHTAEIPGVAGMQSMSDSTSDLGTSNNWLYLQGHVGFGNHYWAIAEELAREIGLTPDQTRFISNQIARNHLVPNWDIAYGEIINGKPRIWASTIDRNYVWDVVDQALKSRARNG